jgi:alanine racemase
MKPTTWVEVSLSALEQNLRAVRAHAGVPVCAVVKANAYGHGLLECARVFERSGAAMLAVTRIEEAGALRDAGIDAPILLLTPPPDAAEAVKVGCAVTVAAASDVERLPRDAHVHLKVDTGMGRLGASPDEAVEVARRIADWATLDAVWTHFADAAGRSGRRQLERFLAVRDEVRAAGLAPLFHAANSAATVALPGACLDMVRVGTLLYGQLPSGVPRAPLPLREAFAWYARVAAVREVPAGAAIGYGSEWRARRRTRVATLPVGYADGLALEPVARSASVGEAARAGGRVAAAMVTPERSLRAVYFGEQRAPVLGRVAMQEVTVSLEGVDGVDVGSIARIPCRRLLVNPQIERQHG